MNFQATEDRWDAERLGVTYDQWVQLGHLRKELESELHAATMEYHNAIEEKRAAYYATWEVAGRAHDRRTHEAWAQYHGAVAEIMGTRVKSRPKGAR